MRSAASRDTDVTKQNNLYIKLQHSSAASLFRTSLEIGQNLHSTAKLRMMFAQLHQFKKLNSILYIILNTLLKICVLPAPPEVCYATPRGVATPSLGSPGLWHRFSKCSVRSPRAPREQPRGSASYLFTYTILTLLILLLSKEAILELMKFDSTLLVCLSSVKFTASMIYLRNVDFF